MSILIYTTCAHASASRHWTKWNSIFEKRPSENRCFFPRRPGRFPTFPRGRERSTCLRSGRRFFPTSGSLRRLLPRPRSPPRTSAGKPDRPSAGLDQPLKADLYVCLDDQAACARPTKATGRIALSMSPPVFGLSIGAVAEDDRRSTDVTRCPWAWARASGETVTVRNCTDVSHRRRRRRRRKFSFPGLETYAYTGCWRHRWPRHTTRAHAYRDHGHSICVRAEQNNAPSRFTFPLDPTQIRSFWFDAASAIAHRRLYRFTSSRTQTPFVIRTLLGFVDVRNVKKKKHIFWFSPRNCY